jgi:hypothetical protein
MASCSDPRLPGIAPVEADATMIALLREALRSEGSAPGLEQDPHQLDIGVEAAFRNGVVPAVRFGLPGVSYLAARTLAVRTGVGIGASASKNLTRSTLSHLAEGFAVGRLYEYSNVCMSTAA